MKIKLPILLFLVSSNIFLLQSMDHDSSFKPDFTSALLAHVKGNQPSHQTLDYFISRGADSNAADNEGKTPLIFLAQTGYLDGVKLLLEKEVHIDYQDENGCTAFMNVVKSFIPLDRKKALMELLLEHGADINSHNKQGDTPLHMAMRRNDKTIVNFLLEKGADVNAIGNSGYNALHMLALKSIDVSFAPLLLARGARVTARDHKGLLPIEKAKKEKNKAELTRILKQHAEKLLANDSEAQEAIRVLKNCPLWLRKEAIDQITAGWGQKVTREFKSSILKYLGWNVCWDFCKEE
jgi:ankyrin repeat protein